MAHDSASSSPPIAASAGSDTPHFAVGQRLQSVRLARGLSQRELARRAKMTNGSLSLIEQGKVSPSLGSLEKILHAIPMTLAEFFAETESAPAICSAPEWTQLRQGGAIISFMPSLYRDDNCPQLLQVELAPRACENNGFLGGKGGFIAGVVLSGQLELRLDGVCRMLDTGDGFQFAGLRGQQFCNRQEEPCRFVLLSWQGRSGG